MQRSYKAAAEFSVVSSNIATTLIVLRVIQWDAALMVKASCRTITFRKRAFMYCLYGEVNQHILAYCDADVQHASAPSLQWFPIQTAKLLVSRFTCSYRKCPLAANTFGRLLIRLAFNFFGHPPLLELCTCMPLQVFESNIKISTCLGTPCSLGTTGPVQLGGHLALSPLTSLWYLTMKQSEMAPARCP